MGAKDGVVPVWRELVDDRIDEDAADDQPAR